MVTLILSILATVLSVVSLGWQFWTWRQSGAVVRVTTGYTVLVAGSRAGASHISVTARNIGRAPVQVTSFAFGLPNGNNLVVPVPAAWSDPLPHVLANGTSASWHVPTKDLQQACNERAVRLQDLRAFVSLGTGKTAKARRRGIGVR